MRRTYRRPKPKLQIDEYRINEKITVPEVRVIDDEGGNLGVMPTAEALRRAQEMEVDLVEVSPKANPPVVRLANYGKVRYQLEKHVQKQKAKQKKIETKAVRLSLRISPHDMGIRAQQAEKFLEKGQKLKVEITLRGRERQMQEKAREVVNDFVRTLRQNQHFTLVEEQSLTKQFNGFNIILVNRK